MFVLLSIQILQFCESLILTEHQGKGVKNSRLEVKLNKKWVQPTEFGEIPNFSRLTEQTSKLRYMKKYFHICQGLNLNCIVIRELFVTTELPNDELSSICT